LPEIRIGVAGPLLKALRPGQVYRLEIDGETISAGLRAVIPLRAGASRTVDALFDVVTDGLLDRIQQLPTTPEPRASIDPALSRAPVDGHPIHSAGMPTAPPVAETASLSARASLLRPGNLAELRLSKRVEADGFWLPLSALSEGQRGLWRALVAEPESDTANADTSGRAEAPTRASDRRWRLVSRPIQVLHTDRERVYVRGALQAGDLVVTAGLHRLVPGQWVQIAKVGGSGTDKAH
jgi:hypothetical protein